MMHCNGAGSGACCRCGSTQRVPLLYCGRPKQAPQRTACNSLHHPALHHSCAAAHLVALLPLLILVLQVSTRLRVCVPCDNQREEQQPQAAQRQRPEVSAEADMRAGRRRCAVCTCQCRSAGSQLQLSTVRDLHACMDIAVRAEAEPAAAAVCKPWLYCLHSMCSRGGACAAIPRQNTAIDHAADRAT
jgi:hypothetical protein